MRKNQKILFSLISLVVVLSVYISFSIKNITVDVNTENLQSDAGRKTNYIKPSISQRASVKHKENLGVIISDYKILVNGNSTEANDENVDLLRDKLIGLVAPDSEYKMVHLNLALSMNKYQDYIEKGQESDREESIKFFEDALIKYQQLDYDNG